jgi:selenocysteine lyase/cysteine desulfurase
MESTAAPFAIDGIYLDTATNGIPPLVTIEAMHAELDRWARGAVQPKDYDGYVDRARAAYAELVGVPAGWVSCGPQASVFAGVVAHGTRRDGEVLVPTGEFTSVTFPFAAQGHRLREVPLADLANAIDDDTALVAFSAVQSADGAVADLDAIVAAADRHGCRTYVDVTQAAGWLPVDATRFDYTCCSGYKWLLCPRGTALFTVRPGRFGELTALSANWYAGADIWTSIYGLPLRLAADARRFDVSPAWLCWLGTAHSLEFLLTVGAAERHDHAVGLADEFRRGVGLEPGRSAIVSLAIGEAAAGRLADAGIATSTRAGRTRVGFYLYNSPDDVAAAVAAIVG